MSENGTTNGQVHKALTPDEMKAKTRELRIVNRYKREMVQSNLLEGFIDYYGWANFQGGTDLYEPWLRQFNQNGARFPITQPADRTRGKKWPIWVTEAQLNSFRQGSRIAVATNSYAAGLNGNLVNSIIGKGFNYKVGARDNIEAKQFAGPQPEPMGDETPPPSPLDQLVTGVQNWLTHFFARNNWTPTGEPEHIDYEAEEQGTLAAGSTKEREACWRVPRDGEVIIRIFRNEDGTVDVRFVDPELVWGFPPDKTYEDGWSFGIQHKVWKVADEDGRVRVHHDRETILAYFVRPSEPGEFANNEIGGEIVSAFDIIQIKMPMEDAEVKHGTPLYTFETLDSLIRASRGMAITSMTSAVQASTAEYWKHQIGTKEQIASLQNPGARTSYPGFTNGSGVETFPVIPGQVRRGPGTQEPVDLPSPHGPAFLEVWQGDLRQAGASTQAPEYMISGDASNANFASTSESGAPWVNARESDQEHFKAPFLRLCWRAIKWAVYKQRLPLEAMTLLELTVEAPIIHKDNKAEMAQVMTAELQAKVTSPQIEMGKRGNDPKRVMEDWKEYNKLQPQQPGAMPGGEGNPQGGGLPGEAVDPKRSQAAKMAAQQRGLNTQESAELMETKDTSGHEHASDTGQFTSGGGDGGEAKPKEDAKANHAEAHAAYTGRQEKRSKHIDALENADPANMAKLPLDLLSKFGLEDKDVEKAKAISEKHKPKIERKREAYNKVKARLDEHADKWDAWKKDNPEPVVLDEPKKPERQAPVYSENFTPEQEADYDKAYADYESGVEQDDAAYDKAYGAYEKSVEKSDKWQEKNEAFSDKADEIKSDLEDKEGEFEDAKGERLGDLEDHISDAVSDKLESLYNEYNDDEEPESDVTESAEFDDRAYAEHPRDESAPADDDAHALFGTDADVAESKDASGHEHKGSGEGGGQFSTSSASIHESADPTFDDYKQRFEKMLED